MTTRRIQTRFITYIVEFEQPEPSEDPDEPQIDPLVDQDEWKVISSAIIPFKLGDWVTQEEIDKHCQPDV